MFVRSLYRLVLCGAVLLAWGASVTRAQAPEAREQFAEAAAARPSEDDIQLQLTAGTSLAYGNARNLAVNLAGVFQLRLGQHALNLEAGWVYGLAAARIGDGTPGRENEFGDLDENANNFTAKARYDLFLTDDDALFGVGLVRRDPFASLRPRIGGQVGYLRNLHREENHRLWLEAGYDVTYDRFGETLVVGTDEGMDVLSNDRVLHSLRLFLGYTNQLNELLTYQTGFQALMRLDDPRHWRFEWINQFRSKIEEWLQVALDITGRFDSLPPGQAEPWNEQGNQATQMFDLLVTLNLVGTFDFLTPEEEEEEEEEEDCECPEPTCADAEVPEENEDVPDDSAEAVDTSGSGETTLQDATGESAQSEGEPEEGDGGEAVDPPSAAESESVPEESPEP